MRRGETIFGPAGSALPGWWHGNSLALPSGLLMKILVVSDLHFGLTQFDWVAQQAENYDLVVIAGDLLDIAGHLDLDSQIIVVVKYLKAISEKTRLLVCS